MGSELERALQDAEALRQQLDVAHRALEDFTHSVSHDLRAPLRHVGAYLKIAQEDLGPGADPAILAHLRTAGDAAAQMGRLMDGLLELSRLGRAELHLSGVDLGQLLGDLLRQRETTDAGRALVWHVAPDLPVVQGDLALLGQLFERLLDNAAKFTRQNAAARVDIGWRALQPGWCEVFVRDNGVGFDPRFQDRLFRVFQRLHSGRQFEGQGVGLAFARLVAERHGGTIRAEAALAGGCTVSLALPLADHAVA